MKDGYSIKWINDLKMYSSIVSSFILEGNIHDLHAVEEDDEYLYLPVEQVIARLLGEKYSVVYFDHTKKPGKPIQEGEETPEQDEDTGEAEPKKDDFSFNSFEFANEKDEANIKMFKRYYTQSYVDEVSRETKNNLQGGLTLDMFRVHDAVRDYDELVQQDEFKDAKPFLFVLKDVSRYMTRPGQPSDGENPSLIVLFKTIELVNVSSRMVLLVDKNNDLPSWFEAENSNPSTKKLFLPFPDSDFRKKYYGFEMDEILNAPNDPKKKEKLIDKYAAYTEKYTVRKLEQLKAFIESSDDDFDKDLTYIEKTIVKFDLGQTTDPWKNPDLVRKVKELKEDVEKNIFGQNHVVSRIQATLNSAVAGVTTTKQNDRRPKAIFFLAGPTGVGKTEITKLITKNIFANPDRMIRFDMSEFKEEHTDARLFGAPPGYVGYEAGGELTKAIKQNPFSVVLFDEIEKANHRIWDKFLQILGDGRLTDGKGETVYFSQSIIVFTSNLGVTADVGLSVEQIDNFLAIWKTKESDLIGEIEAARANNETERVKAKMNEFIALEKSKVATCGIRYSYINDKLFSTYYSLVPNKEYARPLTFFNDFCDDVIKANVKNFFEKIGRREVLGRIGEDNIIIFHFLDERNAKLIAENSIKKFQEFLLEEHDSHITLEVSEEAKEFIKNKASQPEVLELGGRGIVSTAELYLREPVGKYVLNHVGEDKLKATMELEDGELAVK